VRRINKRAALAALSTDLHPPPASFDAGARYRIAVVTPVPVVQGDTSHMLRPGQLIVVSGVFAQSIRQFIRSARAV
jgi:hypothetical protein